MSDAPARRPDRDVTARIASVLVAVLLTGFAVTWWTVKRADREMRQDLLRDTRLIAQSIDTRLVRDLSGTAEDLGRPAYRRLKDHLLALRHSQERYRFAYLLGRHAAGTLFFVVDSEPEDSPECSPPGQAYTETSAGSLQAFGEDVDLIEGPSADRWGRWVTGLVPVFDPQAALSDLATPEDARQMVLRSARFYRQQGRERFLREVNDPAGLFRRDDLYVYVYDEAMTLLAHPIKPELVGRNLIDGRDRDGGKFFRREIRDVALVRGQVTDPAEEAGHEFVFSRRHGRSTASRAKPAPPANRS